MLNTTKVELELISDADMYLLFEKDMRSRVSCITKDTVKPTTSIWNLMNQNKNQNILYAYVVMRCLEDVLEDEKLLR